MVKDSKMFKPPLHTAIERKMFGKYEVRSGDNKGETFILEGTLDLALDFGEFAGVLDGKTGIPVPLSKHIPNRSIWQLGRYAILLEQNTGKECSIGSIYYYSNALGYPSFKFVDISPGTKNRQKMFDATDEYWNRKKGYDDVKNLLRDYEKNTELKKCEKCPNGGFCKLAYKEIK